MQYATLFPHLEGMVLVLRSGEGVCFTDPCYIENATLVMAPQGYRVIEPAGSYPTVGTIRDFVAEAGIRTLGYEDEKMTVAQFEASPRGAAVRDGAAGGRALTPAPGQGGPRDRVAAPGAGHRGEGASTSCRTSAPAPTRTSSRPS